MPDYFHVETRTCGVFLSAGRALAKRRGKPRPVLHPIPVGEVSAGGLDLTGPVPKPRDRRRSREFGLPEPPPHRSILGTPDEALHGEPRNDPAGRGNVAPPTSRQDPPRPHAAPRTTEGPG